MKAVAAAAPLPETPLRHRNLPLLLLEAREEILSHFRGILNRFGVTEQQWRILRVLHEHGDLEPWQIADACRISSPSLAGILARMDSTGMVRRRQSAVDQRRQTVSLTAASKRQVSAMVPLVERQSRLLEEAVGEETIAALYAAADTALERVRHATIASALDAAPPDLSATP
jgi:homoprotocatechuate degradation regulator HpaR